MDKVIIIRYSEIFLKGKNFGFFEKSLYNNIAEKLSEYDLNLSRINKRFLIENYNVKDEKKIVGYLEQYLVYVPLV